MKGKYSEKEISYMRHYFTENSATGNQEYYINIGDDILDSTTNASWATKPSTKELVQGLITTKQKKMIKEVTAFELGYYLERGWEIDEVLEILGEGF